MKKLYKIIILILIIIFVIVSLFIYKNISEQKKLSECLEPLDITIPSGLGYLDRCFEDCCSKEGQDRQECFDFCYMLN